MIPRLIVSPRLIFSIIVFSQTIPVSQQILITEIMYDLDGSDSPNEFVELYNPSTTDTLNLDGWSIQDRSSTDELIESGYGLKIPPLFYGLILEGDYAIDSGLYQSTIPENAILIKVDDSSIGNGLSASDSLFLLDSTGLIIETLGWEDWVQDGFSLERIRLHIENNPSNWSQSLDSLGSPGLMNSVRPDSIDFAIAGITISPEIISLNESGTLTGLVANVGLTLGEPEILVYVNGEFFTNEFPGNISELDTVEFELEMGPFESGSQTILITINMAGDSNQSNNSDSTFLGVRYEFRTFVLNEFMPRPASGLPEFVEIVNISSNPVNMYNWRITDNNVGTNYGLGAITIAANGYGVIAADSSLIDSVPEGIPYIVPNGGFPTLNNSGDIIRIFDPYYTQIDSLTYSTDWGISQGVSLEKYYVNDVSSNQINWAPSTSPSGFTIGAPNSITPANINGALLSELIFYSPRIPTESDEVTLTVPILNLGSSIFEGLVQIIENESMIHESSFTSGNMGDTVLIDVNIGPFSSGFHELNIFLTIENDDEDENNSGLDTVKVRFPFGTIMLNEFMSAPNNDQSEFVECIAFQDLEMKGWGIGDNHKEPMGLASFFISSGDFIVILSDSTIIDIIDNEAHVLIPSPFPSLNNSADGVYLFDHTGSIIDSLIYDSDWPLSSERSTEKKRPSYLSNEPENWEVADEGIGSTPGFQNSKMILDVDGMILADSIFYSPFPPFPDSVVTLNIPIINVGIEPLNGTFTIEMNDDEIGNNSFYFIPVNDTVWITSDIIAPSSGIHEGIIILDISDDGNPENDIAPFSVSVRYPFGTVLINEFFAVPDSTQSEFVEIIPQKNVNVNNWSIMDYGGSKRIFPDFNLDSFSYCVVTSDSSFIIPDSSTLIFPVGGLPGLNNTSETIYLLDHTESIIDSIHYNEDWPLMASRSSEKYRLSDESNDMKNWGISVGEIGQTPGTQNSLFFADLPSKGKIELSPNPFSPDGNGIEDELILSYNLPFTEAALRWEVIDMAGRIIAKPYYNYYVGQNGELSWDGKRDNGDFARIGIYIIKLSFRDASSSKLWEVVKTIVLAKPL